MQLPVFLLIDTGHNSRLYSTVDVTKFSYFNYCVYSVMSFMVLKQADSRPDGPSRIIHVHVYSSTTLLQCFDTVGWVIRPVKTVGRVTYIVLVQT